MSIDPIADALSKIKNATRAQKETVEIKWSKLLEDLVAVLKREGYVSNFRKLSIAERAYLRVYLRYNKDKKPFIKRIERFSKPGLRVYMKSKQLCAKGHFGTVILTTSKGIFTDKEAKEKNLGGEPLCLIY
jgi:small subunit ribosomal protein S8